ncbi:hypothetical protein E9993_10150 [Labilibacter sediminis]|nr:hypothetical protein E9993_10150 [Labilibacter sediminis]
MFKSSKIITLLSLAFYLFACNNVSNNDATIVLAEVDGKTLTQAELKIAIPNNLSKNDSMAFCQNYINRWIKSELLLRKAELNLTPEEKDVEQILENYRASLLIHKYQQKLLLQKYSPLITLNEIEEYYNNMSENFKLDKDIIQGVFIQIPLSSPNLNQVKKWYKSEDPEDFIKLEEYCYQNAQKFDDFTEKWVPVSDISELLPTPIPDRAIFLKHNKTFETKDSLSHYMVSIRDYHYANETAPLHYVEDKIKAILLNKKRIEFIRNLEEELYNEGLKQKVIKFY